MGDGIFGKLKVLIGIEEVEDEEEETPKATAMERKSIDLRTTNSSARLESRESKENADTRVVQMANRATGQIQFKMIVIEPKGFDECPKLVDSLKAKKPVIINLEKLDTDTARKMFDFLSGATYALNGNVQRVANNIFLFAPENVDVTAYVDQQAPGSTVQNSNPWR